MPKYKVTKSFMYTGTTTISAPNLQTAESYAEDITKEDFEVSLALACSLDEWEGDVWINSVTQQENDDEC